MTDTLYADWGVQLAETDIDRLVIETLITWMATYLTQAERTRELDEHLLARPLAQSFQNALEDTDFPDGRLPAIVVTTANAENVQAFANRAYSADFTVVVSAIVRGRTVFETREVAAVFGACVRAILVHQQLSLDGTQVLWTGGQVMPVPDQTDKGRWLAAAVNSFTVTADEALTGDGPVVPDPGDPPYPAPDPDDPDAPYDPLVRVQDVQTTITGLPPTRSS